MPPPLCMGAGSAENYPGFDGAPLRLFLGTAGYSIATAGVDATYALSGVLQVYVDADYSRYPAHIEH
eukprot:6106268-Prymnesium_polylepis.1